MRSAYHIKDREQKRRPAMFALPTKAAADKCDYCGLNYSSCSCGKGKRWDDDDYTNEDED